MTFEDSSMRALNEKYLKKFIRKFWLQPIPETCEKVPHEVMFADNMSAASASSMYNSEEDEEDKYNSVEDGLNHVTPNNSNNSPNKLNNNKSNCSSNHRPSYKGHRRQPSYSNVDLIFLDVRKWKKEMRKKTFFQTFVTYGETVFCHKYV